jgi:hypothetical protein
MHHRRRVGARERMVRMTPRYWRGVGIAAWLSVVITGLTAVTVLS